MLVWTAHLDCRGPLSFQRGQLLIELLGVALVGFILLLQCIHFKDQRFYFPVQVPVYFMRCLQLDCELLDPDHTSQAQLLVSLQAQRISTSVQDLKQSAHVSHTLSAASSGPVSELEQEEVQARALS